MLITTDVAHPKFEVKHVYRQTGLRTTMGTWVVMEFYTAMTCLIEAGNREGMSPVNIVAFKRHLDILTQLLNVETIKENMTRASQ